MVKKDYSSKTVASAVVLTKVVEKTLALEAEVSRLRHHVSVLSKRLHRLTVTKKEEDGKMVVDEAGVEGLGEEVASSLGVQEPEPHVAKPSEPDLVSYAVAMGDKDVVVWGVAGAVVAVWVVAPEEMEEEVALVRCYR